MAGVVDETGARVIALISTRLHNIFDNRIDLADVAGKPSTHVEPFFRTRALAALAILNEGGISADSAGSCVTDSGNDDGIDAIYIDKNDKTIYFVQSKWRGTPQKGVELFDFTRFRDGVRSVLALNWNPENASLHRFKTQLEEALEDIDTSVVMILAHTSEQPIADNIRSKIDEFVAAQNKYVPDFLQFKEFGLTQAAQAARFQARPEKINVDILLGNWGVMRQPYEAIYGSIAALDVVRWYEEHGKRLFAENLRYTIEKSTINDGIIETAEQVPQHFWYFNNGITAICETYAKQPIGGDSTDTGVFRVHRISVINGAQTIGSLARAKANGAALERARVQIRVISLGGTPDGFSTSVTNANNTQNDLNPVDFVAADGTQERIRKEAASMGLIYTFRRGDTEPEADGGFDIRTATIAAACACGDLRVAVASKRYISGLWRNTKEEPYTKLFNDKTTANYLWYVVRVMRAVDKCLMDASKTLAGRDKLVAVHGNRFILYYLFEKFKKDNCFDKSDYDEDKRSILTEVQNVLEKIIPQVSALFPDAYPGNIFKNNERQQQILSAIAES
jgi:hypothetical protein